MTVIELSDDQATALRAKAARQGLTLESWIQKMANEDTAIEADFSDPHPMQTVANIVLEEMGKVPAEIMARMPKDGASQHDHYLYGWHKKDE